MSLSPGYLVAAPKLPVRFCLQGRRSTNKQAANDTRIFGALSGKQQIESLNQISASRPSMSTREGNVDAFLPG
jgi:hypothetical protein